MRSVLAHWNNWMLTILDSLSRANIVCQFVHDLQVLMAIMQLASTMAPTHQRALRGHNVQVQLTALVLP